jgi:uncharacterized protein (DUF362 family)
MHLRGSKYIVDFLIKAMDGKGTIIIGDAPLQNCNFDNLKQITNIEKIIKDVKNKHPLIDIHIEDWRITKIGDSSKEGHKYKFTENEAVSNGYKIVDLGKESFLEDLSGFFNRFRVTKYKTSLMKKHHSLGKHEYLITDSLFKADFLVNIPKMKTHIKTGLTGAMKNMVGVNGHKEFLPHHIKGSYFEGGDNYCNPSFLRRVYEDIYDYFWENMDTMKGYKRKIYLKTLSFIWRLSNIFNNDNISAGSWSGNNTIWRTVIDLNHIIYFKEQKPLKCLTIVDAVCSGQGEGPLEPEPKKTNMLIAGYNPAFVDMVIAKIMGYCVARIPSVYNAINDRRSKFSGDSNVDFIIKQSKDGVFKVGIDDIESLNFKKPKYWRGA